MLKKLYGRTIRANNCWFLSEKYQFEIIKIKTKHKTHDKWQGESNLYKFCYTAHATTLQLAWICGQSWNTPKIATTDNKYGYLRLALSVNADNQFPLNCWWQLLGAEYFSVNRVLHTSFRERRVRKTALTSWNFLCHPVYLVCLTKICFTANFTYTLFVSLGATV